jgi:AcrR family transcriptional regulator
MPKVTQAHVDARRTQILDAAAACFARRGLNRTTIQDVIQESGLSAGAIYSYFSSKDDIIEAIASDRHARERRAIEHAGHETDLRQALAQLTRYFFDALQDQDERAQRRVGIQLWAEALMNERLSVLVRSGVDEPRKMLAAAIEKAQRAGQVRSDLQPDALARMIISLFHGFVLQQAWDTNVQLAPYRAGLDALLEALLTSAGSKNKVPRVPKALF